MYNIRPRVIPILLLKGMGLVKTTQFKNPKYVGDPVNAIKIFNDKMVDELVFLDIEATKQGKEPNFSIIEDFASECFMPICYGGGVHSMKAVQKLFFIGIEKVSFNTALVRQPEVIKEASREFGAQSIVASIDIGQDWLKRKKPYLLGASKKVNKTPVEYAKYVEDLGVGEILLTAIYREGMRDGYDLELMNEIAEAVSIPVIANGGAGTSEHLMDTLQKTQVSAVAAGTLFVFKGPHKAVLINYPDLRQFENL